MENVHSIGQAISFSRLKKTYSMGKFLAKALFYHCPDMVKVHNKGDFLSSGSV
jgi:hypothetical protein